MTRPDDEFDEDDFLGPDPQDPDMDEIDDEEPDALDHEWEDNPFDGPANPEY